MKNIILFLVAFSFSAYVHAQDVHLSQYYTSDLSLNPALTGHTKGDFKAVLNYRNQWSQINGPILTNFVSIEKKFHRFKDEVGVGLIIMDDRVKAVGYGINKFMLSTSYVKEYYGHRIGFGIQGGFISYTSGLTSGSFPLQWDYSAGIFDESLSTGETSDGSSSYLDINSGIYWTKKIGRLTPTVGYSAFHLNHPNQAVISNGVSLPFRSVIHSQVEISLNTVVLHPHIVYMATSKAKNPIYGINAVKQLGDYRALLGIETRHKDAMIAIFGIGYKEWDLGFSYDFNTSGLSETISQKSAFEISLIYVHPDKKHAKEFTVPCGIF